MQSIPHGETDHRRKTKARKLRIKIIFPFKQLPSLTPGPSTALGVLSVAGCGRRAWRNERQEHIAVVACNQSLGQVGLSLHRKVS